MSRSLRIAVADDEQDMRDYFQQMLPLLGHEVVAVAANGRELVERCRDARPDLIITDVRMPDMDGIEAAARCAEGEPIPAILVSAYHDAELLERAKEDHVMAYLVKPIKQADLGPAITLAMRRFEQFRAVAKEAGDLRQALEERKLVERAKGAVMKRLRVDEEEAFRRMRKLSSKRNRKLVEVAHDVLDAEGVFHQLDDL
jgi:response regulator NasT